MDLIVSLGFLGSVAAIVGLLLPAQTWRLRIVHVVYGLVIVALSYWLLGSRTRIVRIQAAEKAARAILDNRTSYSDAGFIQGSLAFLEKHKTEFPDTYQRANRICEEN